jgi:ATP:corrinoid adenosyltransferase
MDGAIRGMARMFPELDPNTIENRGERLFYEAARQLPAEYAVIYGYRYYDKDGTLREADFIVLHPTHGFVVVEVKQGEPAFFNHQWHERKSGGYVPMAKNPVEQARNAMFHIVNCYRSETKRDFPQKWRYAVCFPEAAGIGKGSRLPADLIPESLWLQRDTEALNERLDAWLQTDSGPGSRDAMQKLLNLLTPDFRTYQSLMDRVDAFHRAANRILTEEQERILEETMEDHRRMFLGAAGTGKTFIAIEKARRSAKAGKKVLLTCFNKNLVLSITAQLNDERVTVMNFHNLIEQVLRQNGIPAEPREGEWDRYFETELAEMGYEYFSSASDDEKYDCILIDEGQDFREEWVLCLENMLRGDKELYMFADPNQNIFGVPDQWKKLKPFTVSTLRLTRNFRNTEAINEWTVPYVQGKPAKSLIAGGDPVTTHAWHDLAEQKRLVEREIGQLVSRGVPPGRIMILSPFKWENSCLKGTHKLRAWPIVPYGSNEYGIPFATIRSFKGLETDFLMLIDVRDSKACTPADVYVGATRARFMLHVFHHIDWKLPQCQVSGTF